MSDYHSPQVRSYNMSRIKSRDTKPENIVRLYLFSRGLRYRKNDKRYPGKPDAVFPKYRTVLFVNGCFCIATKGAKTLLYRNRILITGYQNSPATGNMTQ